MGSPKAVDRFHTDRTAPCRVQDQQGTRHLRVRAHERETKNGGRRMNSSQQEWTVELLTIGNIGVLAVGTK
jgi:hypothetical protein